MASTRMRGNVVDWQAMVARQAGSGLSVAAFCARERLSAASFYQWRSRLRRDAVPAAAPAAFVDLGSLSPGGRLELRIDLGGGVVLQLARG